MLVDKPEVLARALPDFVPRDHRNWVPSVDSGFLEALIAEMGVGELLTGERFDTGDRAVSRFWQEIILISDCPRSQYDALRQTLSVIGPPAGNIACVALTGQGFHGQHERQWTVARGNLHLSAIIACDLPVAQWAQVMPALPAVAVAEAVASLSGEQAVPGIKWVNDILLDESKVAGVLTSLRTHRGRITAVVFGVGLNVAVVPTLAADHLAVPATSLQAALPDREFQLGLVLETVLEVLAKRFVQLQANGTAELLAAYRRLSLVLGRQVAIWPDEAGVAGPLCTGEVIGIEADLTLRLRGVSDPVSGGRLTFLGPGT